MLQGKRMALIGVATAIMAIVAVGGRTEAANPPSFTYFSGVVFTQGFGLYIANNTGSTQSAKVFVRDANGTVQMTVSQQGNLDNIPAHTWVFQGYGCGASANCPLTATVVTHSKKVSPSLDNDPPGTVSNEELPAGTFMLQ